MCTPKEQHGCRLSSSGRFCRFTKNIISRTKTISQRVDQRVRYHKNSGDCNINTLSPSVLAYILSKMNSLSKEDKLNLVAKEVLDDYTDVIYLSNKIDLIVSLKVGV